jgi:hypothetical protein
VWIFVARTETVLMGDVTRFSGMFAKMAVEYSRSVPRRLRPAGSSGPASAHEAKSDDERAVREAMERAIARRLRATTEA